jgi:hypothetical protein
VGKDRFAQRGRVKDGVFVGGGGCLRTSRAAADVTIELPIPYDGRCHSGNGRLGDEAQTIGVDRNTDPLCTPAKPLQGINNNQLRRSTVEMYGLESAIG